MWYVKSFKEMLELEKFLNTNAIQAETHHPTILCNASGHYVLVWYEPP